MSELYHRRTWSKPRKDHKYTRREWKNNHWTYYYDDGTTTTGYPKGQNYKTIDQVKAGQQAKIEQQKNAQKQAQAKQEKIQQYASSADSLIKKGKDVIDKINFYMAIPVKDIFKLNQKEASHVVQGSTQNKEKTLDIKEVRREKKLQRAEEMNNVWKPLYNEQMNNLAKNNPLPSLPVKKSPSTYDEDMEVINPGYSTNKDNEYNQNCALCSLTYELRMRGYDVEAKEEVKVFGKPTGLSNFAITNCYKDTNVFDYTSSEKISKKYNCSSDMGEQLNALEKELLQHGDGARGELGVYWTVGGGHSVVWQVEKGEVVVRDCQTNTKYKLEDYSGHIKRFEYLRTDTLEMNKDVLKYVRTRSR